MIIIKHEQSKVDEEQKKVHKKTATYIFRHANGYYIRNSECNVSPIIIYLFPFIKF